MKILHIASHKGNVGDIINHQGFYSIFSKTFGEMDITKVEMRDFYYSAKERKKFNKEYADIINTFDLCILGGGGFFDAQWQNSTTGTTLDFSEDFVDSITIPVLVNAMGYHEYPGITNDVIRDSFRKLLEKMSAKSNWLLTVRNDGSYERLLNTYGKELVKRIYKVTDNGFFCPLSQVDEKKEKLLGLCVTNDLFSNEFNNGLKEEEFNLMIAEFMDRQLKKGWKILLVPHTPADVEVIGLILKNVSNEYKRNAIMIAGYDACSDVAVEQLGLFYSRCSCVIGMRFHSVITGINLKIPTIALAGHEQIKALYEDIGLEDYCIVANDKEFTNRLEVLCDECMNEQAFVNKYNELYLRLNGEKKKYIEQVKTFLEKEN